MLPASIEDPIIAAAQGMIGKARLRAGTNDIAIVGICEDDPDGGQVTRLYARERDGVLAVTRAVYPEAVKTIGALSQPVSPDAFLLVITYRKTIEALEIMCPRGTEGVLN